MPSAVVEILSPGNRSSKNASGALMDRACELLEFKPHLLLVDLFPPWRIRPLSRRLLTCHFPVPAALFQLLELLGQIICTWLRGQGPRYNSGSLGVALHPQHGVSETMIRWRWVAAVTTCRVAVIVSCLVARPLFPPSEKGGQDALQQEPKYQGLPASFWAFALKGYPAGGDYFPGIPEHVLAKHKSELADKAPPKQLLEKLHSGDPEAVPVLSHLLNDPDQMVAREAVYALARSRADKDKVFPLLLQALKKTKQSITFQSLVWAIQKQDKDRFTKEAIPVMVERITDPVPEIGGASVFQLGHVGTDAKAAVPKLVQVLGGDHKGKSDLMLQALVPWAVALMQIDPVGSEKVAMPLLIETINRNDPNTCLRGVWAVENIGPPAKLATPILLAILNGDKDKDWAPFFQRSLRAVVPKALRKIDPVIKLPEKPQD
jgi:hypothetical protein